MNPYFNCTSLLLEDVVDWGAVVAVGVAQQSHALLAALAAEPSEINELRVK